MEYPMKKLIPSNFFYERYPNVLVFQLGNTVRVGFKFYKDTQDSLVIFTFDAALKDIIMTVPEGMELSLGAMLDMANEAERQIKCGNLGSMCLGLLATFFTQTRNYRNGKMEEGIDHSIVGILSEMINSENDVGYAVTQYQKLKERFEEEINGKRFAKTKGGWAMDLDGGIHAVMAPNPYARPEGMTQAYEAIGNNLRGTYIGIDRPTTMVADDDALRIRATAALDEQLDAARLRILAGMMEDLGPTRLATEPPELDTLWARNQRRRMNDMIDNLAVDDLDLPVEELPVENLPVQELPEPLLPDDEFVLRPDNLDVGEWIEQGGVVDVPFNVAMPHDYLVPQRGGDEEMF